MKTIKIIIMSSIAVLSISSCMTGQLSTILPIGGQSTAIISMEADAVSGRLYNQNASNWNTALRETGCGLFAMANAVYALNGNKMDMNSLSCWAKSNGYWTSSGTKRDLLYPNITGKFGKTYGFTIDSMQYGSITNSNLINHLKKGGVAVAHVGIAGNNGHFIAITGYNSSNGTYHVIDIVNRCAGTSVDSWKSAKFLSSANNNNYTKVDWFALVSKSSDTYFPKYTGSSSSITEALKAVGADSFY